MIIATATGTQAVYDTVNMNELLFKVDGLNTNMKFDGANWTQVGINAPTTASVTIAASGTGSFSGRYVYAMTFANSYTGHESNYLSIGSVTAASASYIALSNFPTSSDSQVDTFKLYRTTDLGSGTASVYYYVKTIDASATSTTDNASDASIDTNPTAPTDKGVPPIARYLVQNGGHLFYLGDGKETRGTVSYTSNSTTITGKTSGTYQTYFVDEMVGKEIVIGNEGLRYVITAVNEGTQVLIVSVRYQGTTGSGIFTIKGDSRQIAFSEPNEPESVNATYELTSQRGEITGGAKLYNDVFIFFKDQVGIWDYTTDPDPISGNSNFVQINNHIGCISERTIALCENRLVFMGVDGVYSIEARAGTVSSYDVNELSIPIRNRFVENIDGSNPEWMHAFFDTTENEYVLWVKESIYAGEGFDVGDDQLNFANVQYRFNFDTQTWTRQANVVAASSVEFTDNLSDHYVVYDNGLGGLCEYSRGYVDGYGLFSGAISSATSVTVTFASATLPTGDFTLRGVPIEIIDGTGEGQIRRIISNTTSTATIEKAWSDIPNSSSTVALGRINCTWTSRMEEFGTADKPKLVRYFYMTFNAVSASTTTCKVRFLEGMDLNPWTPTETTTGLDGITITSGEPWVDVDTTYSDGNIAIPISPTSRFITAEIQVATINQEFEILTYSYDQKPKQDLSTMFVTEGEE